ncbi:MAG TPA: preprotein translocase subunit SecG [Methylophilaceae bacterium]|nr:preprotein translocase subunit SecG [Methylophilaceae bacterium]
METIVMALHVLASIGVIGLVLLQHGKGADMGAAFGSGASGSLFGVSGSSNFLSRATAILVAIFFVTSLALAYLSGNRGEGASVIKNAVQTTAPASKSQGDAKPAAPTAEDVPQ